MTLDPIVTIEHAKRLNMCSRGIRQWFEINGLDYSQFLKEGLPASQVEATNNALAIKVAAMAREEATK